MGDADPRLLFHDLVHLNRAGAAVYSETVAADLRDLAGAGLVRLGNAQGLLAARPDCPSAAP
jgi:hypothetical protein